MKWERKKERKSKKKYDFDVFYYNGKDWKNRKNDGTEEAVDGEIDLIIQEGDVLHPIEIKMSAMPKAIMASEFDVLDGIPDKKTRHGSHNLFTRQKTVPS